MAFPEEERPSPEPKGQLPIAVLCLLVAVALLQIPSDAQDEMARTLRSTVLQPFVVVQEHVAQSQMRRAEVEELRVRKDSLVARAAALEGLAEENRRLRDLLELQERAGPEFVSASVVRPGTQGSESLFVVDVGSRDGVRENSPVIAEEGLVGVIREVSLGHAVGMDWTHPDFGVSVTTRQGDIYGIAHPSRGPFREADRLLLDGLPYQSHLDESTTVITSGLGGVFPRGLVVGRVVEVHEEGAGWRRSYRLQPAVEVGSVTHALVLTGDPLPEGVPGEDEPEDLAYLWPEGPLDPGGGKAALAGPPVAGLPESLLMGRGDVGRVSPDELDAPSDPEAPPAAGEEGAAGLSGAAFAGPEAGPRLGLPRSPVAPLPPPTSHVP